METAEQIVNENFEAAAQVAPALREYPDALIERYHAEGVDIDPVAVRENVIGGISVLWLLMEENITFLMEAFPKDMPASIEHFGERYSLGHSLLDVPEREEGFCMLAHFVVCLAMNTYTTELFDIYQETGEGEDDEFDEFSGWPVKADPLMVMGHIEVALATIPFDARSLTGVRAYTNRWLGEVLMYHTKPPAKSKYH